MCTVYIGIGIILLLASMASLADCTVTVEISTEDKQCSQVIGSIRKNWIGESYYSFRGIPYAQAPVGKLRFRDPQPLAQLPATIDARYNGHDCPSITALNASENCLTLNVHSKQLTPGRPLPVLVFIHPGGLYLGSGLSSFLGPEYLLSKSLVLVTFNYRLGTLGFLNLGNADVPGNAGFKDQGLVLQWVRKHIASFGGNPHDVTLMGYSAGALSVSLHLVSPQTRHLFHKAIVMSGSLPPQAAKPRQHQRLLALKQAAVLDCNLPSQQSDEQLLECLNRFNGTHIAATLRRLFDFGKDNPVYLWLPIIEGAHGQEQFHTVDLYTALRNGNFTPLPILVGYTNGEFCTSAAEIFRNTSLLQQLRSDFKNLAPKILMYEPNDNKTAALRRHYSHDEQPWSFSRLCDLFSDTLIRFGAQRLATLAATAKATVYSYEFVYRGRYSNLAYETHWGKERVEHMDDLMYLFRMDHDIKPTDEDAHIVQLYVNFMYEFIRNGELRTAANERVPSYPESHALINEQVTYTNGIQFADALIWEQLFP